jgi:hypothetical protein
MNDKKRSSAGDQIIVGDISHSTGIAIGRGAKTSVTQGLSGTDLAAVFAPIYRAIQARPADPDVDRDEIKEVAQKIEKEATKGLEANPGKVERWLSFLAKMAPDILDVTVACLTNPAAGIATAIRKVAQKAKEGAATA